MRYGEKGCGFSESLTWGVQGFFQHYGTAASFPRAPGIVYTVHRFARQGLGGNPIPAPQRAHMGKPGVLLFFISD